MDDVLSIPAEPKRRRVPPPKVREAIDLIVQGRVKTITAAAKKVGLTRERLSRALGEPHIAEHLRQKAARAVATGAGRAAARLVGLLDAKSEHVSFDAARHTLAIAGIKPAAEASMNLNVNVKAGYVIKLVAPGQPPMRIVGGAEPAALPAPVGEGNING